MSSQSTKSSSFTLPPSLTVINNMWGFQQSCSPTLLRTWLQNKECNHLAIDAMICETLMMQYAYPPGCMDKLIIQRPGPWDPCFITMTHFWDILLEERSILEFNIINKPILTFQRFQQDFVWNQRRFFYYKYNLKISLLTLLATMSGIGTVLELWRTWLEITNCQPNEMPSNFYRTSVHKSFRCFIWRLKLHCNLWEHCIKPQHHRNH